MEYRNNELEAIKNTIKKYKEKPEILKQALIKAGIIKKNNKLTKKYKNERT
jgi:hypothetical protein